MQLLHFFILALAVWRLSSLLVNEDGPNEIFADLRARIKGYTGLMECIWCLSVWIGFAVAAAWIFYPTETALVCLPFALSALAIGWDRWING